MFRTRRGHRVAIPAAALLLSAPLLTGCGMFGSATESSSSSAKSSASQSSEGSGGATSSAPADDSASESASSSSSASQDASGKPSKDEVKAGLRTYYIGQGLPSAAAESFAGCMVDEGYDDLSAKTLNAMKDGKPESIDPADTTTFTKISGTCGSRLSGGALPSNLPLPS